MTRKLGVMIAAVVFWASVAGAAVAPKSDETLQEMADLIVVGKVTKVTSKLELKGFGTEGNRIFRIETSVLEVIKGESSKVGETIDVEAWRPSFRLLPAPGPQGHSDVAKAGDTVTLYLTKHSSGVYGAIMPNGIKPGKPKK